MQLFLARVMALYRAFVAFLHCPSHRMAKQQIHSRILDSWLRELWLLYGRKNDVRTLLMHGDQTRRSGLRDVSGEPVSRGDVRIVVPA